MYKFVSDLESEVLQRIREQDFDAALNLVCSFVSDVWNSDLSVANVFGSRPLDTLCERIGSEVWIKEYKNQTGERAAERNLDVFIATELYRTGGHTAVIEQIIDVQPEKKHKILLTDIFRSADYDSIAKRFAGLNVSVERAPDVSLLDKLKWLQERLATLGPSRTFLFNHHQDAVAIAAVQPELDSEIIFYHHADHHLCLGVFLTSAIHVDPHNLGFFNCRNQLGIECNIYWPLAVRDRRSRPSDLLFLGDGTLRTCTSGSSGKLERPYRYSYPEEVPNLLEVTGGVHIHIGELSSRAVQVIHDGLEKRGIAKERFVLIPWVRSLWDTMIQQRVDLYISSFPLGGGLAAVEVMGSGTPMVVHESYLSRFHGGGDLVYPEAFNWKTVSQLHGYIRELTPERLKQESLSARKHYERCYSINSLREALSKVGGTGSTNLTPVPLRPYTPDMLQRYLDQKNHITERVAALRDGQIASLNQAVAERDGQIASLNQAVASLNQAVAERDHQLHTIQHSKSWRLTAPLRRVGSVARWCWWQIGRSARVSSHLVSMIRVTLSAMARWGPVGLSKRSIRAIRKSGVRGFLRRVENLQDLLLHETISKEIRNCYPAKPLAFWGHESHDGRTIPKIAYVVNQQDLMTQVYRVLNYADALTVHGYTCKIFCDDEVGPNTDIDADILVLNRILWNKNIGRLIRRFRETGRQAVFDIDDFVFDPDQMPMLRHSAGMPDHEQELLRSMMQRLRETMQACDFATVTTFALKIEVEKRGLHAFVLPNNNGLSQIKFSKTIGSVPASNVTDRSPVRIGYFSGTRTHEKDFIECADALRRVLSENPGAELMIVGHLDLPLSLAGFESHIKYQPLMPHQKMLEVLSTVDINLAPLELNNVFTACKSELKIFEAALFGVPTVASPTATFVSVIENGKTGYLAATPEEWYAAITSLVRDRNLRRRIGEAARDIISTRYAVTTTVEEAKVIYDAAMSGRLRRRTDYSLDLAMDPARPLITVVAVLYRKAREVRYFLEALRRQDFPGHYEIILVDDETPDDSVAAVQDFLKWAAFTPNANTRMDVRILRNPANIGNCGSRNAAIRQARADVLIIVDADCMFNQSFLSAHFAAHMKGDCDVAIGPINIETGDAPPLSVLGRHEASLVLAELESQPQDPINLESFVNCVTRNFSIQRAFLEKKLKGNLFDEAFSYSADPQSGFGWEDVEMGYRVYQAGGRIKYLPETVSIHVSHESSVNGSEKPLRSLRNFRRLFEKHPEILFASRQWSIRTYEAIMGWARSVGADPVGNPDFHWLHARFRRYVQAPIVVTRNRILRILTYRWHVPHQYELYKTGHEFTLVTHTGTALCDSWESDKRPIPRNARMVPVDRVDPREFDLAILHFDENVLRPDLCRGKVPNDWGLTLRWFIENIDLPKVAICHGTPQFNGQYNGAYKGDDLGQVLEHERMAMLNLLGDIMVVCNSNQAQFEWGFKNSRTIWHGFSPHEYPPGSHERGALVMQEAALRNRPHYNGLFIYESVCHIVGDRLKPECLKTPDPLPGYSPASPEWAVAKYQNYAREIGRYSIYFNPTIRSPMPRMRGEAMMAGLVSVSLRNHDVDLFIKSGVNGFYADTPEELAEQLIWLAERPRALATIGRASRATAMDIFNQDRYLSSWNDLLYEMSA